VGLDALLSLQSQGFLFFFFFFFLVGLEFELRAQAIILLKQAFHVLNHTSGPFFALVIVEVGDS
jgi:hypothetical protein